MASRTARGHRQGLKAASESDAMQRGSLADSSAPRAAGRQARQLEANFHLGDRLETEIRVLDEFPEEDLRVGLDG